MSPKMSHFIWVGEKEREWEWSHGNERSPSFSNFHCPTYSKKYFHKVRRGYKQNLINNRGLGATTYSIFNLGKWICGASRQGLSFHASSCKMPYKLYINLISNHYSDHILFCPYSNLSKMVMERAFVWEISKKRNNSRTSWFSTIWANDK